VPADTGAANHDRADFGTAGGRVPRSVAGGRVVPRRVASRGSRATGLGQGAQAPPVVAATLGPANVPRELRRLIYGWLDDVVVWVNEDHTWRTDHVIPLCWVEHRHIVHELATVACLRWEAGSAITPGALENWHRYTLPMFLERIAQRIGTTGCPPGRHQPSPGEGRNALYRDGNELAQRRRYRNQDSELDPFGRCRNLRPLTTRRTRSD
jgi:hypothetical protein